MVPKARKYQTEPLNMQHGTPQFTQKVWCWWLAWIWTESFPGNLTLLESTEKCWLKWDLNSHLRDTGLLLYLLSYRVHRDPEGVSSNPTWVNVFQLTTAVSDCHENLLLEYIKQFWDECKTWTIPDPANSFFTCTKLES